MLIELDRHDDEPGGREGEEPQDEGQLRARKPHHHLMCDELAAAGKIAGVALDIAARAMMGQRDRFAARADVLTRRSEEHTSDLQSLMRISYAVFCLIKKKQTR